MSYIPSLTLPSAIFANPAISILLPIACGMSSGYVSTGFLRTGYKSLRKPPLNPPDWVFGPVWTTLYALMGYGAYRAWHSGMASLDPLRVEDARRGATLYTVQLALNMLYTPVYFALRQPVAGMVDILVLDAAVVWLATVWARVDQVALYTLVPYLGWLSMATYLTAGLGVLNGWNFKQADKPKGQ